jgi:hypothetical protein
MLISVNRYSSDFGSMALRRGGDIEKLDRIDDLFERVPEYEEGRLAGGERTVALL